MVLRKISCDWIHEIQLIIFINISLDVFWSSKTLYETECVKNLFFYREFKFGCHKEEVAKRFRLIFLILSDWDSLSYINFCSFFHKTYMQPIMSFELSVYECISRNESIIFISKKIFSIRRTNYKSRWEQMSFFLKVTCYPYAKFTYARVHFDQCSD